MSEFKPGDTVALKSGGHPMTVHYMPANPMQSGIDCVWFDEAGNQSRAAFYDGVLAPIVRTSVRIDEVTIRYVWVFAETGEPIADHIAMRAA